MKNKVFKLQQCWVVDGWQTELNEGFGCSVIYKDGFYKDDRVMFFSSNKEYDFEMCSKWKVFFDKDSALKALEKERSEYKKYLSDTIQQSKTKLKELYNEQP